MAMNIKNNDLELLRTICVDLDRTANSALDEDVIKRAADLKILVDRLEQQRDVARKRAADFVKERRKTDPTYGRSEKEIERILGVKHRRY